MQLKEQVINNFSSQAHAYDRHADVQVWAAHRLIEEIKQSAELIPGAILEIGCGTGSLTLSLLESFVDREIIVSDLSAPMLTICRERILSQFGRIPENVELRLIDGETFEEPSRFAAIVSSFALQWLTDLDGPLPRLLNSLASKGAFFFSVPSNRSFPEWKELCLAAGVPFTGNPLPALSLFSEIAHRSSCQASLREDSITFAYPSMLAFLRYLKALGASTPMNKNRLSLQQISQLIDYSERTNPSGIILTYEIIFGKITKR